MSFYLSNDLIDSTILPWIFKSLYKAAAAAAKSCQSCLTLCDPIDGSPPGFPSPGFSRQEHWSGLPFPSPMHESESEVAQSCPTLATPWTTAYQAPPSMGFSRQKYWSGVSLPSPVPCLGPLNSFSHDLKESSRLLKHFPGVLEIFDLGLDWIFFQV